MTYERLQMTRARQLGLLVVACAVGIGLVQLARKTILRRHIAPEFSCAVGLPTQFDRWDLDTVAEAAAMKEYVDLVESLK